jgi:uncharacterized spore protein YtfJ
MVIENLVKTVLSELKTITQTETIVGDPIEVRGVTIIPVSKVSIGFGIGGAKAAEKNREGEGTGGGVLIEPVAFIVVRGGKAELLSMKKDGMGLGQIVDLIPEVLDTIKGFRTEKPKTGVPAGGAKKKK